LRGIATAMRHVPLMPLVVRARVEWRTCALGIFMQVIA
jgi:hypothetical protein